MRKLQLYNILNFRHLNLYCITFIILVSHPANIYSQNNRQAKLTEENIIDIRYEDFIKDPMKDIEQVYKELRIDGFEEFKEDFERYVATQADYKPNKHKISDEIIRRVNEHWDFIREMHEYERLEPDGTE